MNKINISIIISIIVAPLFYCTHAQAYCFEEAGRLYNISPQLLWSIAKVESNFQPEALNWNRNGTYDFGVMQINSSWRMALGEERWTKLGEPCMNVKVGAWILAQCIARHGYTWKAVGFYNAASKNKRDAYARKVYDVLVRYAHHGMTARLLKTMRIKRPELKS
ncbi:MAG: lytic transglycosylase domain-containing protein [Syntrophales bacterium]